MPQRLFLLACLLSCAWSFKMELRHPGHHNHSGLIQPRGVGVSIQIRAPIEGGLCTDRNTLWLKDGESVVITSPNYEAPARINCGWKFSAERNVVLRIKCDPVDLKRRDMIMIRGGRGSTIRVRGPSTDPIDVVLRRNRFKMSFKTRAKEVSAFSCLVTAGDVDGGEAEDCVCGVANTESRIMGGAETEVNEYPWQVGLTRRGGATPYCGGSIITNLYILTSASCTKGDKASDVTVLVGGHDISDGSNTLIQAKSILVHEDYDDIWENDIALIELEEELDFSDSKIGPICLPVDTSVDYLDVVATVSGWDTSNGAQPTVLRDVKVTVISNSDCDIFFWARTTIMSNMLCTAVEDGKDPCQGDEGGPLFSPIAGDAAFELIGVVMWGSCDHRSFPSVYSRVTDHLYWILSNSRKGVMCPRPTSEPSINKRVHKQTKQPAHIYVKHIHK